MSRTTTFLLLLALLAALGACLATTVPWTVLAGAHPVVDVARDFAPDALRAEEAFHRAVRPPAYASLLAGLAVAAVLGLTPLGARLVTAVARPLGGGWGWQAVLGTGALLVVGRCLTLPFDIRTESVLRSYGLSTRTWSSWAADVVKSLGVAWLLSAIVLVAVLALARAAPRTWGLWGAVVVSLLVVLGSFAYPVLVEPLFARFTPLPAGQLRTDLLAMAQRDGVPVSTVLVADASRRTTALNAYVSGFGSTRRIVVYDTLLRSASPAEIELIVAHELGHAKRRDVLHGTLLAALAGAAGTCALGLLLGWAPLLRRAGAVGPGDPRVVPLVLFLAALAGLLASPVANLVSRRVEARADVHALELTRDAETYVAVQARLATTNLSDLDPSPLQYALFATHPTAPQRIALAREWARLHP